MPSPLDFIQTLSQKVLSGKKAGTENTALTGESGNQAEAFSSALNQALQPKSQPVTQGKSEPTPTSDFKAISETADPDEETANRALLPAELLALQPIPISIAIELPPPVAGITQALGTIAGEPALNELSTKATEAIPQPQSAVQSLPATLGQEAPVTSAVATEASPSLESLAENKEKTRSKNTDPDTMMLAQSVGFSTLSPEAMVMMGLPVEFQIQNTVVPMPSQQALPAVDAPSTIQTPPLQAGISPTQFAPLPPNENAPLAAGTNDDSPSFIQTAALDPTTAPTAQAINPEALSVQNGAQTGVQNPEASFIIEEAGVTTDLPTDLPELPAMLELSTSPEAQPVPETLQFNPGLPEVSPQSSASQTTPSETLTSPLTTETSQNESQTAQQSVQFTQATPSAETLLRPLNNLQQTLQSLNAEIESVGQPNQSPGTFSETFSDTLNEETLSEGDESYGDAPATTPLPFSTNMAAPIGLSENAPANTLDKVPQFLSSSADPTDQVVEGTAYSVKNGHRELILKINPDNLGEVRINLTSLGNNEISAKLIASNPESHALLQKQADTLKTALEAQGIRIERLSVVLAGQTENNANPSRQEQQPQSQSWHQQQSSSTSQQQQSFQQPEQNLNPFFQAGGSFQHKQGFAQNPLGNRYGQQGSNGNNPNTPEVTPTRRNDNGSVSLLA